MGNDIGGTRRGGSGPFLLPPALTLIFLFSGPAYEYDGQSNAAILNALFGCPGFECIQQASHTDVNSKVKKTSHRIIFDFPHLEWLSDPPVQKGIKAPGQTEKDTFGLWPSDTVKPTAERNINPKIKASRAGYDDPKGRPKLTCPPSECSSPKFRDLLESPPLVKNEVD